MKTSLIISTYNWPEALELILKSILVQTLLPDEILIADDGSSEKTKTLIDVFKHKIDRPLIHIWHKDIGFRKAIILNKAIAKAKGDYIIQIDGDCILHKHFIKDHISKSQEKCYLYGSRVNIQKSYLEKLFKTQQINFTVFSKAIKKRGRAIHSLKLSHLYKKRIKFSKKYRGCNASFFKQDLININGYNENFNGWGREDSELALRLQNNNIFSKRLKNCAIVYHIWHNTKSKSQLTKNNNIQNETIQLKKKWCSNGIDKYIYEK